MSLQYPLYQFGVCNVQGQYEVIENFDLAEESADFIRTEQLNIE